MALDKHAKLNPPPSSICGQRPVIQTMLNSGFSYPRSWHRLLGHTISLLHLLLNTRDEKGIMLLGLMETFFWRSICEVALGLFE